MSTVYVSLEQADIATLVAAVEHWGRCAEWNLRSLHATAAERDEALRDWDACRRLLAIPGLTVKASGPSSGIHFTRSEVAEALRADYGEDVAVPGEHMPADIIVAWAAQQWVDGH